ncbi:MAG TPA: FAD-dependent monooxygenase [Candidatus Dormibacteraeota bacterium]|jgi:anthraniloyl-CoA monooxygenase
MRIAVVGGGPGGLFAAALARTSDPTRDVTVFERNRADDTFGFGVVFSDATLAGIHDADPVLRDALADHGVHWDAIEVRLRGERFRCGGNGMGAVARRTLLRVLRERASAAGVRLAFATPVDPDEVVAAGYDLVVAADGANSRLRARFADVFQPSVDTAAARFIWLGTTCPFEGLTFVHERGPHGVFAVHGYPIGSGVSTFIVETDGRSWRRAGLDEFDVTAPPGPSDERSRAYLEDVFAGHLQGHRLLVNNSRWGSFRTHRAARWRHRVGGTAIALLGDGAHTAHFSVGSGTKMAMEDAIALVAALDAHADVDAALAAYETVRRPQVDRIQESARPSLSWWEHFGRTHDALPPWQFAYHFFTRALTDARLGRRDPGFVGAAHGAWRSAHGGGPLDSPIEVAGRRVVGRVLPVDDRAVVLPGGDLPLRGEPAAGGGAWGLRVEAPPGEAELPPALEAVARAADAGAALVAVFGGTPLTRRLLCEEARLRCRTIALLVPDELDEDAALTEVLSGRADLVGVRAERERSGRPRPLARKGGGARER